MGVSSCANARCSCVMDSGRAARSECTATPALTNGWRAASTPRRSASTDAGVVA